MIKQESIKNAIESAKARKYYVLSKSKGGTMQHQQIAENQAELQNITIYALELLLEMTKRNLKIEHIEQYMIFEDECIKRNFTFNSLLEAREMQEAKKPLNVHQHVDHKSGVCPC